jgi:hypothetical protein
MLTIMENDEVKEVKRGCGTLFIWVVALAGLCAGCYCFAWLIMSILSLIMK